MRIRWTLALSFGLCVACSDSNATTAVFDAGTPDTGPGTVVSKPPAKRDAATPPQAGKGGEEKTVAFEVPKTGGSVAVTSSNGMPIDFQFPAKAAGMQVTLTPTVASEIGWPDAQFAEVIKLEPDGTKFDEPIVVRPASGDVIVLTFPSAGDKTRAEGLPLAPGGDGVLLSHFSTLVVVSAEKSCGTSSGWKVGNTAESARHCTDSGFPQYVSFGCQAYPFCVEIAASCCTVDGASACHFGDADLAVSFKASYETHGGEFPYCGRDDAGVAGSGGMSGMPALEAGRGGTVGGATEGGRGGSAGLAAEGGRGGSSVAHGGTGGSHAGSGASAGAPADAGTDWGDDAGSWLQCQPGSGRYCTCSGGKPGEQLCDDRGQYYGACRCGAGGAAGSPSHGGSGGFAGDPDSPGEWSDAGSEWDGDGGVSAICSPGRTYECKCPKGSGSQWCDQRGSSLSPCVCGGTGTGGFGGGDGPISDPGGDDGGLSMICVPNTPQPCKCGPAGVTLDARYCNDRGTGLVGVCQCIGGGWDQDAGAVRPPKAGSGPSSPARVAP